MPFYGKKRNFRKGVKKAASKPKANGVRSVKSVINPALKQYVKKMIDKDTETKFFTLDIANKANITGSGFQTTGPYGWNAASSIIPTINQGTGDQQRVGNDIEPVGKLMVKGYVYALPVNSTNNAYVNTPFYVRIVIWRQKMDLTANNNMQILDDNLTDQGRAFDGTLDDLQQYYNKEKYEIGATKTFLLQPNASIGGVTNTETGPYPCSKQFTLYARLPKKIKYNDSSTAVSNCSWFMSAGIVPTNGVWPLPNTVVRAMISATSFIKYKDA